MLFSLRLMELDHRGPGGGGGFLMDCILVLMLWAQVDVNALMPGSPGSFVQSMFIFSTRSEVLFLKNSFLIFYCSFLKEIIFMY